MSKKKAKPKKSKAPRDPDRQARNRRFAAASLVGVAGVAAFFGARVGLEALNRRAVDTLTPGNPIVTVAWPRDAQGQVWLPSVERERLGKLMTGAAAGGRALSPEPLAQIGRALDETGWFEGTPTVRWTADGQIQAEGRWRPPAAAVRIGPREHLIGYDARLLPLDYPTGESNQIFLLHPAQPEPAVGDAWQGEDVRAALDLVVLLQREGLLGQVAGVDLGEGRESGRLAIITDRGSRVLWGGGPEHLRPGEQPTSIKLKRLHGLIERTGRLDADADLVDLRGPQILLERAGA